MGKSKKAIMKSINSYYERIEEHQEKILIALKTGKNLDSIDHWKKEIENFHNCIKKEKARLKK